MWPRWCNRATDQAAVASSSSNALGRVWGQCSGALGVLGCWVAPGSATLMAATMRTEQWQAATLRNAHDRVDVLLEVRGSSSATTSPMSSLRWLSGPHPAISSEHPGGAPLPLRLARED